MRVLLWFSGDVDLRHVCKSPFMNLGDPWICQHEAGNRKSQDPVLGSGKSDSVILPLIRVITGEGKDGAEKRSANGDKGAEHSVGKPR